jgi:uncharacterized protein (TIGR02145 family)
MKVKDCLMVCTLFIVLIFLAPGCTKEKEEDKITDADENVYTSITIGTQVWMVENLKTTKYNDGTVIPNVTEQNVWQSLTTDAYCWYDNNPSSKNPYGALYNGFAVGTGKLCPIGWHLPLLTELQTLLDYVGEWDNAGGILKETGTDHWKSPNTGATDEYGFNALPGGQRFIGGFNSLGYRGYWWTSTPGSQGSGFNAWFLVNDRERIEWDYGYNPIHGFSVRCIKD